MIPSDGSERLARGSCTEIRDLLAEHALGTLEAERRRDVDRHLVWCAGCRREAAELAEGSALLGLAASEAGPPDDLERRVTGAIHEASGRRRRSRASVLAAVVAAFLAVVAAGWGSVMAGRAERLEQRAESAQEDAEAAAQRFAEVLRVVGADRRPVREAVLRPAAPATGGGRAILYESGDAATSDWVLVLAGGLPEQAGPYRARLMAEGATRGLGRMQPAKPGQLAAYSFFPESLGVYERIVVVDARGRVVLQGTFG